MGGGDLNLKKSWHPSTMKNMEKVWKAEQQDNQEKKRIAELKKEIAMERDREEMTSFAMEHGAIEKKEDKKLDWMYKGPNQSVNRDEYLLGRKIDKQFEQMVQAEKETEAQRAQPTKNHVEHECIPPSLRFFSGNDQVDINRKLQEDPLYAIKKKEQEARSQLLKNPVKLKELQQLVQHMREKSGKKKKKKKRHSSESEKLDDLLAAKFKKLKGEINEEDLMKSIQKLKKSKKSKKKSKKVSSSSSSSSSDSDSDSVSDSDSSSDNRSKKKLKKRTRKSSSSRDHREKHRNRREKSPDRYAKSREKSSSKQSLGYGLMKADGTRISPLRKRSAHSDSDSDHYKRKKPETKRKEQKWVPPKKQKLSEEEKERRRQEMMVNASRRDIERKDNVRRYEEERKNSTKKEDFDKNFVHKHLAAAANKETVASRIKSNINNIQRTKFSMDKNFAKR